MVYIKLYLDDLEALEPYGDAERGRLFTALLEYARTGKVSRLSGNERFLFPMMKARLDRDRDALESLSAQRSEAGKRGGLAKASKAKQGLANAGKAGNDKDKDNNKDDNKDDTPPNSPQGDEGFGRFWQAYPRKVGKGAARAAWGKLAMDDSLREAIMAAVERDKGTAQWQRDGGQYIPYPATWLGQRRWEDEPEGIGRQEAGKSYAGVDLDAMAEFDLPEGW